VGASETASASQMQELFEDLKCWLSLKIDVFGQAKTYKTFVFLYVLLVFSVCRKALKNDAPKRGPAISVGTTADRAGWPGGGYRGEV
jgi:hypothetical protein